MKQLLTLILFLLSSEIPAQISGFITDDSGLPLPYVSIYLQGSSIGTTTNQEGRYQLKVARGQHMVVFQFIGYQSQKKLINYEGTEIEVNVKMEVQPLLLDEIVVAADAEDPAYRVIRKAIEKRKYHNELVQRYSCDVYVKGNNKVLDAPEKILGNEIGDLEGLLDSNRQGIVYLSESVSKLYFQKSDEFKEIVTSSKVSGNDRGYSFNSAKEMQFNIYDNTVDLNRAIISPIANNAMRYYDYRLEGTFYDDSNRLINKISVVPKRKSDPVYFGHIYIVEDMWIVHSLDLSITAQSSQVYFLDTLNFEQVFIPIEGTEVWRLFNNTITFKFSAFGFVVGGTFTAVYSNYSIDPIFDNKLFNRETHIVEKESNERDSNYWAEIRPVPLTIEEVVDYYKKDSLYELHESPAYKDSIDHENNIFKIGDLIGGYNYNNSKEHFYWDISSPISGLSFNTVQGVKGSINFDWRKYYDEDETRRILWYSTIDYGFSEKKLRARAELTYRPNRISSDQYKIFGGTRIQQFNPDRPISTFFNTAYSLLGEKNYSKYYGKSYIGASWRTDLAPGFVLNSTISWENRQALNNHSDWVIIGSDDRNYTSNDPLTPLNESPFFDDHQAFIVDVDLAIRIGQTYVVFPDRRYSDGYSGPKINLSYRGALKAFKGDVEYHKISISLEETLELGVFGEMQYFINSGTFVSPIRVEFADYQHFMGTQILFVSSDEYLKRFLMLPYYELSTSDNFLQAHLHHNFNGWILDKIPGLNQLGLSIVTGAKYLHVGSRPAYFEGHIGLDKIGLKMFRFFRLDAIWSRSSGQSDWGLRLGFGL